MLKSAVVQDLVVSQNSKNFLPQKIESKVRNFQYYFEIDFKWLHMIKKAV